MSNLELKVAVVYSHHKLGDLIWQLPYINSISKNFNKSITLVTRSKTQAKDILKDLDYINSFFYCEFRKGVWYFLEIYYLYIFFKKNKFSHIFILDKVSRPAIAAKLAGIKNIIGPGIKNQKKWLTNKKFLNLNDYKNLNYSDQSKKILELNNLKVFDTIPYLEVKKKTLDDLKPIMEDNNIKRISLGVDSFEIYKVWYEEMFAELADKLIDAKLADEIYLISSQNNKHISDKIIELSSNKNLYNCSNFNLLQVIKVIKKSNFFVGNNSGPLNLASALGIKAFGLIANDKVSELQNSNIIPILPDGYKDEFFRKRSGMKRLTVSKVFEIILKN